MIRIFLIAALAILLVQPMPALAADCLKDAKPDANCSRVLAGKGWRPIASCSSTRGNSRLLGKDKDAMLCDTLMTAKSGITEPPCVPFKGDVQKYKEAAAKAQQRTKEVDEASKAKKLDAYMKAHPERVYCMEADGSVPSGVVTPPAAVAPPAATKPVEKPATKSVTAPSTKKAKSKPSAKKLKGKTKH